jgi:magnesium-transporting ATPase (P-type)
MLCNKSELVEKEDKSWEVKGDPTEGALIVAALKAHNLLMGLETYTKRNLND